MKKGTKVRKVTKVTKVRKVRKVTKGRKVGSDMTEQEVLEAHLLRLQIATARRSVDEGRVVPHEEVKRRVAKWRRSSGR